MNDRLDEAGILAAWEAGAGRRPLDRAMAVLWAAGSADGGDLADLPLADRDRRLLAVRARSFGQVMPARATCPDCGAELELDLDTAALTAALPDEPAPDGLRPITSRDVAAIAGLDAAAAAGALRSRLAVNGADRDPDVLDRKIEAAAEAAELVTRLTCTECGSTWRESLDVPDYLWADVETAALRLIADVSELARTHGWSEAEILAMSPWRRAAYLGVVRAS